MESVNWVLDGVTKRQKSTTAEQTACVDLLSSLYSEHVKINSSGFRMYLTITVATVPFLKF